MLKFCALALGAVLLRGQAYTINTYAGAEVNLNGAPATSAVLYLPQGIAIDSSRNIYVTEERRNRVRKIAPDGTISAIAGMGYGGFGGDGGPAAAALLNSPNGIAVDRDGNIFVVDMNNHRVRKIARDGTISTVAGTTSGFSGDGGPATAAQLSFPRKIAFDADGSMYISDSNNHRIRKIDPRGTITTVAGNGTAGYSGDSGPATAAQLNQPWGVAVDREGRVLFSDLANHRIRRIESNGTVTTVVGNGVNTQLGDGVPATSASIGNPRDVGVDAEGSIYVLQNALIRKVTSGRITNVAGADASGGFRGDGGRAVDALFGPTFGIAFTADGSVLVVDRNNHRIRQISNGTVTTIAGGGHVVPDGSPATSTPLFSPYGLSLDASGNLLVAESEGNSILKISPAGALNRIVGQRGLSGALTLRQTAATTDLNRPVDVVVNAAGDMLVATQNWHRVLRITAAGVVTTFAGTGAAESGGDGGPATQGLLNQPQGLAVDSTGNVYIADTENDQVRKVGTAGVIERLAGQNQAGYRGDNGPANASLLNRPPAVAVDSSGAVIFADFGNSRVRKITAAGVISTVAGNGGGASAASGVGATTVGIGNPTGVAVDAANNIYIVISNRIRRVTPDGTMTTIAGTGVAGFSGDGGLATLAQIAGATRLAVAPDGRIFISDSANQRIRVLTPLRAASMSITRGDNQTGAVNTLLPVPLTVSVVSSTGIGVPGVVVSFAIASGAGRLSSATATTGNDGTASVTLTLGAAAGAVTVTASAQGLSAVTFTQSATAAGGSTGPTPPAIASGGLRSAGLMYAAGQVSPSAIVSIFGSDFAPAGTFRQVGAADVQGAVVPRILDGVCVLFGTTRAALFVLTPTQINLQVPPVTGSVAVRVVKNCGSSSELMSNTLTVSAQAATPEFFSFSLNADGRNPVAAVNAVSGALVGRGGSFTPAKPGDYLTIYATGFGATDPVVPYGELAAGAARVTATVRVRVGTVDLDAADILYAGVAPFNAGLHQLSIRLPESTPGGDLPVVVTVGGASSPAGSYIAVEP